MIRTGKTYNISLSALTIPDHIKDELLAWYHIGAVNNPWGFLNSRVPKYLKSTHLIRTTSDLVRTSNRICTLNPHDFHQDIPNCHATHALKTENLAAQTPIS